MTSQTRPMQYSATQPGAIIRDPHRAERIRRRRRRWSGFRCIQPEHRPHSTEKDSFLSETAQWLNAVPSKSSSGNGNDRRGNGAMVTKDGNGLTQDPMDPSALVV